MKKINVDNINIKFMNDNYIYTISFINEKIILKRIKSVGSKELVIINVDELNVNINVFPQATYLEIDNIVNDIINNLYNCNMVSDIININELYKILKSSYINILISNGIIGLSNKTIKNVKENIYDLDIVLLETNNIIGRISYSDGIVNLEIDDYYKKDVLDLYNNLINLFLCNNSNKYIKILKSNS